MSSEKRYNSHRGIPFPVLGCGVLSARIFAIEFSGIRPGEKLFEELALADKENLRSLHPGIFVVETQGLDGSSLTVLVDELLRVAYAGDSREVLVRLRSVVPEFRSSSADPS